MRGLRRRGLTVMTGAVVIAAAAFNCASNAKTSAAAQSGVSTGSKIKYVAVVETEMDAQSGASAALNPSEVRQITAALRREAVENLPRGTYNIMTSETVQSMGGAVLEECADENCVITLGAKIGADYIVRGIISTFGTKFTLSVEMYETDNGMLVASSEYVRADNTAELMDKAMAASANMYRKFVNPRGFTPKQEQAYQPPAPAPPPQQTYQPPAQTYQTPVPAPAPTPQAFADGSGILADSRDGKRYKAAVVGGKRWMAENLNYQTPSGSWCYDNNSSNCDKYGRLYDWKTAKTVCPAGFHLPSRQEWNDLVETAGGYRTAGKKLKAKSGWNKDGNGTDEYGFSALPGGSRTDGSFGSAGYIGIWWTASSEYGDGRAYNRGMSYHTHYVDEENHYNNNGYSVRCVADN